jgi:hypothetical protein
MTEPYDPVLQHYIEQSMDRIRHDLSAALPLTAAPIEAWMRDLAGNLPPAAYFTHPHAFPMLLLPWWLAQTLAPAPDQPFQADVIYSTMNGYYYIRMIDNLMDGHATGELPLLPALGFFHTRFTQPYYRHYAADHAFWPTFETIWFQSADHTIQDGLLETIDLEQFMQISGHKVGAGKIPLAAVCHYYQRPDMLEPWTALFELLGCWHQMFNDLFGWQKDLTNQTRTFFLSEAQRRKQPDEHIVTWIMHTGISWGVELLQEWLGRLGEQAQLLQSPALLDYLAQRSQALSAQHATIDQDLRQMAALLRAAGRKE